MEIVNIADLIDSKDPQGRTFREINKAKQHQIPIGSLVEVKWDEWFGDGGCWKVHARLWVVDHTRDCDGTPLYSISRWNNTELAKQSGNIHGGFSESMLTVVVLNQRLKDGYESLEWEENDR